jgi:hypothetical protein
LKTIAAILVIALATQPALAWNSTGHKAIALIAYQHLSQTTKQRVDSLLAKHPDYPKWIEGAAPAGRGRAAFLEASVWPDAIRNDRRFHGDNRQPTPDIPGLPPGSQARHAGWHFINLPFSPDETPTLPPQEPNILTKLRDFEAIGSMPEQMQVYILPWLLHLVGDVHQPLHVLNRFTRSNAQGDRGGNLVRLRSGNLHSYWDSRIGTSETDRFLNQLSATITQRHPRPATV